MKQRKTWTKPIILVLLLAALFLFGWKTILPLCTPDETHINRQLEQWLQKEFGSHASAEDMQVFRTIRIESPRPEIWKYGIFCAFQYDGSVGYAVFHRGSSFLEALSLREARLCLHHSCGTDNIQLAGGISICGEPYRAFLSQAPGSYEIAWGLGDALPTVHYTLASDLDAVLIAGPERKFRLLDESKNVLYEPIA